MLKNSSLAYKNNHSNKMDYKRKILDIKNAQARKVLSVFDNHQMVNNKSTQMAINVWSIVVSYVLYASQPSYVQLHGNRESHNRLYANQNEVPHRIPSMHGSNRDE